MTACVALLRAVNLAGRNTVSMADLRALAAGLGLGDPQTLLQSGNVVFRASARPAARLEQTLEDAALQRLRLETKFFVRTDREWSAIVAANPFRAEARRDPGHLLVMCLRDAPSGEAARALNKAIRGRESARVKGREAYVYYPDGVGRSKLTTALIERTLGTSGTARNWNTVLKIAALLERSAH